ncbi:PREDICTED: kirola-like [Nicotiana attenuata]|uniref:kirola-like n=1 Tax=Nicotiana attenuata TaxID=49451 RepID=UPI000904AEFB|nr:PREDICTED: kirola-like [Nicotiana attenuata]
MGVKGKSIASTEVKCGGDSAHDIFHTNTHHIFNGPSKVNRFEIHEGEIVKVGSIISWKYNEALKKKICKEVVEAFDPHKKSPTWKVIEGDLLELYNSFTIITSSEDQWTKWTFEYRKKIDDTPEPLVFMGLLLDVTKDVEGHLLKK